MADSVSIDLSPIVRAVDVVNDNVIKANNNIDVVNSNVNETKQNTKIINDEVAKLAADFHEFVKASEMRDALQLAESRLIKIRQELEQKYGHYAQVRRTTTGILQATDLEIVRHSTLTDVTEELMIQAPNYWLAPALIALAAWINNQPELSDKGLREAIKRNDEKTSLLFALICRRAGRQDASLKWTQRYLGNQDEENLDRKAVIVLDAYASGLLGSDAEGVISKQMSEWIDHLSSKEGFVDQQTKQWSAAILLKKQPYTVNSYPNLKQYSHTWTALYNVMEGAYLHATIFAYFDRIFSQKSSTATLKVQLDEILDSLVTDFDDEELPLRKEEKLNQFIVDFKGDEQRANANMQIEQSAFEEHKDFTQLLTDAAMKPESSHASVSTQKFSIALSKDWITNAYNDVVANNRAHIPNDIEINIDTFNDKTKDGKNEEELENRFIQLVEKERADALSKVVLDGFTEFCKIGGPVVGGIGLIMMVIGQIWLGLLAVIAGIGMFINWYSKNNRLATQKANVSSQFDTKLTNGKQILRATLAEVVDFRREFAEKDAESQKVTDFLAQVSPDQYVRKLSGSTRKMNVVN